MADERIPEEIIAWMNQKGWSEHHDQWHFQRRWDYWHEIASQPQHPSWVDEMIEDAVAKNWSRSPVQEGESGGGEEFLFMHRAMFQLLVDNFPQHLHFFRGWNSPPQDSNDPEDGVFSDQGPFNPNMESAIKKVEANSSTFSTDDEFGLFLETNLRPVPGDPLARSTDLSTGLHNYLHNRWSDDESPINLGDPRVNIFNQRFWKLHGWIDYRWWKFRKANKFDDTTSSYQTKMTHYIEMMNQEIPHHLARVMKITIEKATRNVFSLDQF